MEHFLASETGSSLDSGRAEEPKAGEPHRGQGEAERDPEGGAPRGGAHLERRQEGGATASHELEAFGAFCLSFLSGRYSMKWIKEQVGRLENEASGSLCGSAGSTASQEGLKELLSLLK